MKNYRLKKEAVNFFKEKHATSIYPFDTWDKLGVDIKALEEVGEPYLSYGHRMSENSATLSGWDSKGSRFEFTIHFPNTKMHEHDEFSNGRIVRELMNKIQSIIDYYFVEFSEKKANKE